MRTIAMLLIGYGLGVCDSSRVNQAVLFIGLGLLIFIIELVKLVIENRKIKPKIIKERAEKQLQWRFIMWTVLFCCCSIMFAVESSILLSIGSLIVFSLGLYQIDQ